MKGKIGLLTTLLLAASVATANNPIATVNVNHCDKVVGTSSPFILVLKRGQPIMESITVCATKAQLRGAALNGIGQVQKPTLAYYNLATKRYQYKNYNGIYELVSLNGNIGLLNGKQDPHVQAVISDNQFKVSGGHLNEGFAGATVEISIIPLKAAPIKKPDNTSGLNLMVSD